MHTVKKILEQILSGFQNWIESHVFERKNILWFRRCCYALLLLKMVLIWPILSIFYDHIIILKTNLMLPHKWMFLPVFQDYYSYYWLVLCLIVFYAIISKGSYLLSAIIFIISANYFFLIHGATNNGDKLLTLFIFMLIFVKYKAKPASVQQMINNLTLLILQLHICLLYLYNVLGKLLQPTWRDGTYFENVWTLPYAANSYFIPDFLTNPNSYFVTSWAVLLFEFAFPVLIWIRRFNKPLLIIGTLFHLGIAIMLSLPDFGLTMIISYILFYNFKKDHVIDPVVR